MQEFNPASRPGAGRGLASDTVLAEREGAASLLANHLIGALGPDARSAILGAGRPVTEAPGNREETSSAPGPVTISGTKKAAASSRAEALGSLRERPFSKACQ